MKRRDNARLAVLLAVGDELPTEFRIFRAGKNETTKGAFVFDDVAAKSVMSDYEKHGADVMLDLEHMSLDDAARNWDPDARGWCQLELRDGELWAVNVRWTPDGEARLRERRQRYISPAFAVDHRTKRITSVLNIAICAMPATHNLEPLIAASERTVTMKLSPNDLKLAASLAAVISQLAAAESPELKTLGTQIDAELDKMMMGGAPSGDPAAPPASSPEAEAAKVAAKAELAAAAVIVAAARDATGKVAADEVKGALVALAMARKENGELAEQVRELAKKVERSEVRELVAANRKKITPAIEAKCLAMGKAELEAALELLTERDFATVREPEKKDAQKVVELSQDELAYCARQGADPKAFLAQKQKLAAARAAEGV